MVKSLETLDQLLDQYEYDELTDLDLMVDCSNDIFLQSCNRNDRFLCECQKWRIIKNMTYQSIVPFLQSYKRNSYLLCECQKWDCFSEKKLFVTLISLIGKCFLMIFSI